MGPPTPAEERITLPIFHQLWSRITVSGTLVWPLVVWSLAPPRLLALCLTCILILPVARAAAVQAELPLLASVLHWVVRVDGLALGAALAILAETRGLEKHRQLAGSLLLIGCGVTAAAILSGADWTHIAAWSAIFAALLLYVVTAPGGSIANRLFSQRWLITFGKYSYAIYVLHSPIRLVLKRLIFGRELPVLCGSQLPATLLYSLLVIGVSWGVAFASWHLYEKHFLKLKSYFPYGKPPTA